MFIKHKIVKANSISAVIIVVDIAKQISIQIHSSESRHIRITSDMWNDRRHL